MVVEGAPVVVVRDCVVEALAYMSVDEVVDAYSSSFEDVE